MREIEFRAKGLYKDRWYYGYYVEHKRSMQYYIIDLDEAVMDTQHLIDKDTLGQYTGVKDKNGTKIFEGDIIELIKNGQPFVIHWDKENCRFLMYKSILYDLIASKSEVIGNIHDNPELLTHQYEDKGE